MSNYHTPVLLQEVITGLDVTAGKRFIDATLGGGGHTRALLEHGADVLAIDEDRDAILENKQLEGPHCRIVQGNFRDIESIAKAHDWTKVDGILFDLGVSSHQIDSVARGFTFRYDTAPLDMRFGVDGSVTAKEIINSSSQEELFNIFATYGEEERAQKIASAIVKARGHQTIITAGELKKVITTAVGSSRDVIARIFQALRIAVNDELTALRMGLTGAAHILGSNGRIAVISFHSLEDRIVKRFFLQDEFELVTKRPIIAGVVEQQQNSRSRSAKLRIAIKRG